MSEIASHVEALPKSKTSMFRLQFEECKSSRIIKTYRHPTSKAEQIDHPVLHITMASFSSKMSWASSTKQIAHSAETAFGSRRSLYSSPKALGQSGFSLLPTVMTHVCSLRVKIYYQHSNLTERAPVIPGKLHPVRV